MEIGTTLVVTAVPNPDEMDSVQTYLKGVLPLLQGAGGKIVKRLKVQEVVSGRPAGMTLVMDFESRESVKDMFESAQYSALIPARQRGFKEMNIFLADDM